MEVRDKYRDLYNKIKDTVDYTKLSEALINIYKDKPQFIRIYSVRSNQYAVRLLNDLYYASDITLQDSFFDDMAIVELSPSEKEHPIYIPVSVKHYVRPAWKDVRDYTGKEPISNNSIPSYLANLNGYIQGIVHSFDMTEYETVIPGIEQLTGIKSCMESKEIARMAYLALSITDIYRGTNCITPNGFFLSADDSHNVQHMVSNYILSAPEYWAVMHDI